MPIFATAGQKVLIDSRRHAECGHPRAGELDTLEFLICRRCGVTLIDGRLDVEPARLAADDPPGVEHLSSYAGEERAPGEPSGPVADSSVAPSSS